MNEKCFGLKQTRGCGILSDGFCRGNYDTCPFYKPKWKADQDRKMALRRIAAKPLEVQRAISEKYFQGEMPWAKEDL